MADRSVTASGKITLGIQGASPELTIGTSPATGVITSHISGKRVITAGTAIQALAFPSGITNAQFIHVKCTDNVTGDAKEVDFTIAPGTGLQFKATDLDVFCATNANITAVSVTVSATGNATLVEWTIAG